MTDNKPVLTAEQWKTARTVSLETVASHYSQGTIIAVVNDALPDSDPRKITREKLGWIRSAIESIVAEWGEAKLDAVRNGDLQAFADALESYLPPA